MVQVKSQGPGFRSSLETLIVLADVFQSLLTSAAIVSNKRLCL